jgi:hypothetical protein
MALGLSATGASRGPPAALTPHRVKCSIYLCWPLPQRIGSRAACPRLGLMDRRGSKIHPIRRSALVGRLDLIRSVVAGFLGIAIDGSRDMPWPAA